MKATKQFQKYMIVSLAIHGLLVIMTLIVPRFYDQTKNIEIVLLEPQAIEEENQDHEFNKNNANQVVETDEKEANNIINEKAKFLSAKNNTVAKETQAKLGEKFKNTQTQNMPKPVRVAEEQLKPSLFGEKFNAYDALEKKSGNKRKNTATQNTEEQQHAQIGSDSTATDKVQNVDMSLKTALNTREYKYYGYYQRIKTQLNQWWQPGVKERVSRLMSKGRTIASVSESGGGNKVTKLIIVLNDAGTLVKVQILSESGVRDLDEAAVEAFRQAAPFPNPPKGMIENDGTIKIRWDFVVES